MKIINAIKKTVENDGDGIKTSMVLITIGIAFALAVLFSTEFIF